MTRLSLLFPPDQARLVLQPEPPPFFTDLLLDQVVNGVAAGREEYHLNPFFYTPLPSVRGVLFRQAVMKDLEDSMLFAQVADFASAMRTVRSHLALSREAYWQRQQERWFLDAVGLYCHAVSRLAEHLSAARLQSAGLLEFRRFLLAYASGPAFRQLRDEADRLRAALSSLRYATLIRGLLVEVRHHQGETDYSAEITHTFQRFRQTHSSGYQFTFPNSSNMNHVEAQVLDGVAALYPELFADLAAFRGAHGSFLEPAIEAFDREVQFYMAYLEYIAPMKRAGLNFCYPRIGDSSQRVYAHQCFDLALAARLVREGSLPVCNDFCLNDPERIIIVTGPNQGGKTTFARTFGQLHYLASLGCPVPAASARLSLPDRIFSHFERGEPVASPQGQLEHDVLRIHQILQAATASSVLVINEVFSSTTLRDALSLARQVISAISELDAFCVWVTFLDELASWSAKTVSMVATVTPDNPEVRTFKIVRRPADGLAYALTLARKHGLTYDAIRERVRP
ncbi:MAG: DNA mismatch repair protein MutS [Armatimonadota bacterium]|nr:DNA mismatch repair protein MutS [Armatimonadota bacterium]